MNKYELCVIFKPTLEEEVYKSEFQKVIGYIEGAGGVVEKIDELGKRKLAYEIQKMNEGSYVFVVFSAENTAPLEVEQRIRIMESLLRFLIIRQEG